MANIDEGASTAVAPGYILVVVHPFTDYERGAVIADADAIAAVTAGENAHHVRKVKN